MPRDLEFWYALSPGLRVLVASAIVSMTLVLCWWGVIRPLELAQRELDAQLKTQQHAGQLRWKALMNLRPPDTPDVREKTQPFSPLVFQTGGKALLRWQPNVMGGEMVLASAWDDVPATFLQLAERNMLVAEFSLVMKEDALHFILQLERGDDG